MAQRIKQVHLRFSWVGNAAGGFPVMELSRKDTMTGVPRERELWVFRKIGGLVDKRFCVANAKEN